MTESRLSSKSAQSVATLTSARAQVDGCSTLVDAIQKLRAWMEPVQFAGHEPYDILNAPLLKGQWARTPPFSIALIQFGKRVGGLQLRRFLRIPASRNPKALGLCLAGYCDLARMGYDVRAEAEWLKAELIRLRSPQESDFCWGYDWDFISRGGSMPAFSGNCIASCFCGAALQEMFDVFGDREALEMASSVARFLVLRLNRSFESEAEVCFSYTPNDRSLIFNSSALASAFLARVGKLQGNLEYLSLAKKGIAFLARHQLQAGGWPYGCLRRQQWIDSFHTSYNVCAMLDYQTASGDREFEEAMRRGHGYYKQAFFTPEGAPKYFDKRTFPIDIHACSQAILHFAAFAGQDAEALVLAQRAFAWTMKNMAAVDGSFYYQKHRLWTNRTPYMRWGQAWMFHAMTRLLVTMNGKQDVVKSSALGLAE